MFIYQIINNVNGHFYIGKTTKGVEVRFKQHCKLATSGSNTYLHRAMRLYGTESFSIQLIETVESDLNKAEIRHISTLQPHYNMTTGGDGGDTSKSPNFISSLARRKSNKGLSYEQIYGEELGKMLRGARSLSNLSRGPRDHITKQKISSTRKNNILLGLIVPGKPPTQPKELVEQNLALMNAHHKCVYCGKEANLGNISRWHNDKCKHKK